MYSSDFESGVNCGSPPSAIFCGDQFAVGVM